MSPYAWGSIYVLLVFVLLFVFFELKRTPIPIIVIDAIEAAAIVGGNCSGSGEGDGNGEEVGDGSGVFEPLKA
jgi:hypothetical protein